MRKLLLLLIIIIPLEGLYAQNEPFSNKPVQYEKWEGTSFLPFAAGKFEQHNGGTYDPFNNGFPEKDAKSLSLKLTEAVEELKRSPLLSPPQGVDVYVSKINNVESSLINSNPKLNGHISIGFFTLLLDPNGKQTRILESNTWTDIWFNNPDLIVSSLPVVGDVFVKPVKSAEFMGYPVYSIDGSNVAIVHKKDKPLWIPVTQEECLDKMIDKLQKTIDKMRADKAKEDIDKAATIQNLDDKTKRKKEFETAYKQLLAIDKSAAEELKKTFEETETELSSISAENKISMAKENENPLLTEMINNKKQLENELQSLSEEEKKQQAYWGGSSDGDKVSTSLFGLTNKNMPGAEPLVRINPELFDKNRPASDIQLIVVEWSGSQPSNYSEGKEGYNIQNWKQIQFLKEAAVWNYIFKTIE